MHLIKTIAIIIGLTYVCFSNGVITLYKNTTPFSIEAVSTEMLGKTYVLKGTALSFDNRFWYITVKDGPSILLPVNRYFCKCLKGKGE